MSNAHLLYRELLKEFKEARDELLAKYTKEQEQCDKICDDEGAMYTAGIIRGVEKMYDSFPSNPYGDFR